MIRWLKKRLGLCPPKEAGLLSNQEIIDELMDWMPYSYSHYERNAPHKLSP